MKPISLFMAIPACLMLLDAQAKAQAVPEIPLIPGQTIPTGVNELPILKRIIESNPNNLDNYFNYAQVASSLEQYELAEKAYLHMLAVDPLLHRVRLDLALVYVRIGQYERAKVLFEEVLNTNPPRKVREKVQFLLKKIEKELEKHQVSGGVVVGYNFDSNATSSPDSASVTFNDINIPLGDSVGDKADGHYFTNARIDYRYRMDTKSEKVGVDWNVRGTAYQAKQVKKDTLDLAVLGVKAGPTVELKEHKTRIGLNGGYQWVQLDNEEYLKLFSLDLNTSYFPTKNLSLFSIATFEKRHFINSTTSSTYSDRSGEAYQLKTGFQYLLPNKDVIGSSVFYRREKARVGYLSNNQIDISTNYTHSFGQDIFANVLVGYNLSHYDDLDVFVSSLKKRDDSEKYITFTVGKKFKSDITLTVGYQYRNVTSSIQNYEYDNHRTTVALGWSF